MISGFVITPLPVRENKKDATETAIRSPLWHVQLNLIGSLRENLIMMPLRVLMLMSSCYSCADENTITKNAKGMSDAKKKKKKGLAKSLSDILKTC